MSATERWEAFLKQIAARHQSVREEAAQQVQSLAAGLADADMSPITRAWTAADARLKELEYRISDTWSTQVDDAFDSEGLGAATRASAYEKGNALQFALENAHEETHVRLFADLARGLFEQALASRRGRFCTECGKPLVIPITFRAIDLYCGSCGTKTQFEPGDFMRQVAAVGAHALAQEAALGPWRAMRKAERDIRKARSPCPLPLLKAYERAQIAYWQAYVAARAKIEPEMGCDLAHEVRARMAAWYAAVQHEREWMRAGDPRELKA